MTKTTTDTCNQRFSSVYPQDEKMLESIAIGVASGEYEDFAKAVKAVLAAFKHDDVEANRRRLWDWYKKGDWATSGRKAYVEQEIRKRGMAVKPTTDDPDVLRRWLIGTLDDVISGYIEYSHMVLDEVGDSRGDQFLFEDYLHNWWAHDDNGRQSVEQLLGSIRPAIHRFYEFMLITEEHGSDKTGISTNYPVTTVTFSIDPSKPLQHEYLREKSPGVMEVGDMRVVYKNPPILDNRWLMSETKAWKDSINNNGLWRDRHMFRWPKKVDSAANGKAKITVTFEHVPQQGAAPYVSVTAL